MTGDFNWVSNLRGRLNRAGFRGAEQEDGLAEIFTRMTYVTDTGGSGYLWDYKGPSRLPFDRWYQLVAKQKVNSRMRDTKTRREVMPTVPITPSRREEDAGGIAEQTLEGQFEEPLETREEITRLFGQFRDHLGQQRNSEKLLQVFDFQAQGLTQKEIVEPSGLLHCYVPVNLTTTGEHLFFGVQLCFLHRFQFFGSHRR